MDLVSIAGGRSGLLARNVWHFRQGENWGVLGTDAATQSLFCLLAAGLLPPPAGATVVFGEGVEGQVRLVSFAQQRQAARQAGFLQARYCSIEDETGPGESVRERLSFNRIFDVNPFEVGHPRRRERRAYREMWPRMVERLGLTPLLSRPVMSLSNGEMRRVLLACALLANPAFLVLDDPCAGLDPEHREQVKRICDEVAAQGCALLVSVRHPDELPECLTHGLELARGCIARQGPIKALKALKAPKALKAVKAPASLAEPVVEFRNLKVAFGRRKLFDGFSWTVRRGERWLLKGRNGSGKTTLLALVTGDSPLAYANDVVVFGRRRGAGGTLAETRRRIGMVSPEQQAYLGCDAEELLAAALAKNPDLLLLDEPCLNLDAPRAARLRRRIASWLRRHPRATAICVAHRNDDVPPGFGPVLSLDAPTMGLQSRSDLGKMSKHAP